MLVRILYDNIYLQIKTTNMEREMSIGKSGRNLEFDGKVAFEFWVVSGSLQRALAHYNAWANENGKETTVRTETISYAAKAWCLKNQDEAKEILSKTNVVDRYWENDEEWIKLMLMWAFHVFNRSPGGFLNWLRMDQNKLIVEQYSDWYEAKFARLYGKDFSKV